MDKIEIKKRIIKILNENFNFYGEHNQKIFFDLDSINYLKYLLILEQNFNVLINIKNISTINESVDAVYKKINDSI
jgi:acyl carrier protein